MTTLAVLCLALVCSISNTATEQADHGNTLIADELFENTADKMQRTNTNIRLDVHKDNTKDVTSIANTNIRLDVYNENTKEVTSKANRHVSISNGNKTRQYDVKVRNKRAAPDPRCGPFTFTEGASRLSSPMKANRTDNTYANNISCITTIKAPNDNEVVTLTFVDEFHIEDHPKCDYDYLEVRDGQYGFEKSFKRLCGKTFPSQIKSTGPYLWLKFKTDDNIEYEGFKINIKFDPGTITNKPSPNCLINLNGTTYGEIKLDSEDEKVKSCKSSSPNSLDILWKITTAVGTQIYLDFQQYVLQFPNECEKNLVQVFGAEPNFDNDLAYYCGLVANPLTTNKVEGHIMYVRMFLIQTAKEKSVLHAKYTAFRTLQGTEECRPEEFDCADSTCIDNALICNNYPNCRLKADEEGDQCKKAAESLIKETHILVILIIFSLILSGMCFVFLFKCIRKLYQDHKLIKKHIEDSCEDRLDQLIDNQLTLDAKQLERDSEPRPSLERDNHTNEMYKQQRNNRKPSSIDSDYLPETHIDLDDEMWRQEAESIPIDTEDIRIEHKGRSRRSDTSKKEESLRSKGSKEETNKKRENRDASVGAPDTKESGCQTRESLFQAETAPSSDGSGSNSRGFSTFGYSGATIVRPSPAPANTSQITIELLRQVTPQESVKSQKKMDRRPMSSETTRSAPDVIIVSKPIG